MAEPLLITPPTEEPISLAQARRHLRLPDDQTSEDADILDWIATARERAEHELGRKLITQTWDVLFDGFPSGLDAIELHADLGKPQSIVQITYLDQAGGQQTLPTSVYSLDAQTAPGYVFLKDGQTWPADAAISANSVRVRLVVGFGAAASVPRSIISWMKMQLALLHRFRDPLIVGTVVAEVPTEYTRALLWPHSSRHGIA